MVFLQGKAKPLGAIRANKEGQEEISRMNKSLISIALIMALMGSAAALGGKPGLELQPGEAAAEMLFDHGIGEPWIGGDPSHTSESYSLYSQYFSISPDYTSSQGSTAKKAAKKAPKKHIETPKKHNPAGAKPSAVYLTHKMEAVPYAKYKSYSTYAGGNELWILGTSSWTRYARVPQGASLSLLATSSAGGNGYLYEIYPDGTLSQKRLNFFSGGNQIGFHADSIGQHILLFITNGQVSNAIVVEVESYHPPYQPPVIYPSTRPPATPPSSTYGDTPVTIVSQGMREYQVFLDGNLIGTEGNGGDRSDGRFSFRVAGNQNHEIRVYDGQFNYPKTMYFQRGVQKIINVEPGTAVYI